MAVFCHIALLKVHLSRHFCYHSCLFPSIFSLLNFLKLKIQQCCPHLYNRTAVLIYPQNGKVLEVVLHLQLPSVSWGLIIILYLKNVDPFFNKTSTILLQQLGKNGNLCLLLNLPQPITESECIKHICLDGQLIQVNKSQNCPYNATQPSCGVLGFATQTNGDKCCPKWECACKF